MLGVSSILMIVHARVFNCKKLTPVMRSHDNIAIFTVESPTRVATICPTRVVIIHERGADSVIDHVSTIYTESEHVLAIHTIYVPGAYPH